MRRHDVPDETLPRYQATLAQGLDYREQGLFGHIMARVIMAEIHQCLERGEAEKLSRYLDYLERFAVFPPQEELIQILDLLVRSPFATQGMCMRVRDLIRRVGVWTVSGG